MVRRRAGLSYRQRPDSLLKQVGGKPVVPSSSRLRRDVPDDAPPIGSSDEEDEGHVTSPERPRNRISRPKLDTDSSDDDDEPGKGDIKSTTFGSAKANGERESGRANGARNGYGTGSATANTRKRRSESGASTERSSPSAKRRKGNNTLFIPKKKPPSAAHLKDEHGFTKKQQISATYGRKPASSQESQTKTAKSQSAKDRPRLKAAPDDDSLDSPERRGRAKIRVPMAKSQSAKERLGLKAAPDEDDLDSPERPGRAKLAAKSRLAKDKPRLKAAPDEDDLDSLDLPDSPEQPDRVKLAAKSRSAKDKPRLKSAPPDDQDSLESPERPGRAKLRAPADLHSSLSQSPPRRRFVKPSQDTNDNNDSSQVSQASQASSARTLTLRQTAPQNQKPGKHTKAAVLKKATPPKPPRPSPPPKFKAPGDLPEASPVGSQEDDDDELNDSPAELSELSELSDLESQDSQYAPKIPISPARATPPPPKTAACPWCGEKVAEDLLKDFSKGKHLNVRMQTRFCQKHKKATAMSAWRDRNYPDPIPWRSLRDRFTLHRPHLLSIVRGSSPSHYRSLLASKIETGQARNLKREANLNPGYYGPRGFNLMCDWLVGEFGAMLKERAVGDRVIAGRGSAAFIESVLVAELAVRLIGEDMDVGVEEARVVLEESKALGDVMHEEAE